MLNKHRLLLAGLVSLCGLYQPSVLAQSSSPAGHQQVQAKIQGKILDAQTLQPIQGAYVRQQDALNAVFSGQNGMFALELLPGFSKVVVFQAEGYESVALPFTQAQNQLEIQLQPLTRYQSDLPPAHTSEPSAGERKIIANQFTAFYQGNYTLFRQNQASVQGVVLNEWGVAADLLPFYPLNFRGRFFRSRQPVDIANFPFQPAFYINHQQAKIGTGWVYQLDGPLDVYLGGDLMLDSRSPDNRSNQDQTPIAFTGSLLDYEQTRLGAGINAMLGWQISDRLALFPEVTLYPVMFNFIDRPSDKIDYNLAGEVGAKLRFEVVPGVYAVGQYYTQLWYGFGNQAFENNHFFHLGVSLDPWTIAEKLL